MNIKKIKLFILKKMILESSETLNLRGVRGYGVGHPYPKQKSKPLLGSSDYEEKESKGNKSGKRKPVKISRAFRK